MSINDLKRKGGKVSGIVSAIKMLVFRVQHERKMSGSIRGVAVPHECSLWVQTPNLFLAGDGSDKVLQCQEALQAGV